MTEASNVVPFPRQFRIVPRVPVAVTPGIGEAKIAVDHVGRLYVLQDLLRGLTPEKLRTVEAAAPRSGQDIWDEVVRNWPVLADAIVAGLPDGH